MSTGKRGTRENTEEIRLELPDMPGPGLKRERRLTAESAEVAETLDAALGLLCRPTAPSVDL
jgi:hypothetical protein